MYKQVVPTGSNGVLECTARGEPPPKRPLAKVPQPSSCPPSMLPGLPARRSLRVHSVPVILATLYSTNFSKFHDHDLATPRLCSCLVLTIPFRAGGVTTVQVYTSPLFQRYDVGFSQTNWYSRKETTSMRTSSCVAPVPPFAPSTGISTIRAPGRPLGEHATLSLLSRRKPCPKQARNTHRVRSKAPDTTKHSLATAVDSRKPSPNSVSPFPAPPEGAASKGAWILSVCGRLSPSACFNTRPPAPVPVPTAPGTIWAIADTPVVMLVLAVRLGLMLRFASSTVDGCTPHASIVVTAESCAC